MPTRRAVADRSERTSSRRALTAALAVGIFAIDVLTSLEGAVAVLYVVVVLLAAQPFGRLGVALTGASCLCLTAMAYVVSHGSAPIGSPLLRCTVSLVAVGVTTMLVLANLRTTTALAEKAGLVELTHDSVFVRDHRDVIIFWNRAAEELYGWRQADVLGRVAHELLRTVFPAGREAATAALLATGHWEGELLHTKRSGETVVVESSWALQRDAEGGPVSVLETNTDITARKAAHAALVASEHRYRTIFNTTRVSILQWDWRRVRQALDALDATASADIEAHLACHPDVVARLRASAPIVDANDVTLRLLGAADKPAALRSLDAFLPDSEPAFARALVALARGERFFEGETQMRTRAAGTVPILFGITFPEPGDDFANVLVFAVDITERKQNQEALLALQAELAYAARKATLGELTASIAHEVNQPLAAIVTNGQAALRWLARDRPDLREASDAITRVVANGARAAEIVAGIRTFLTNAPRREPILFAAMIDEAAALIEREIARHGVVLIREVEPHLPPVVGDRVQLQQVMINLMVNAVQAMAAVTQRRRVLRVRVTREDGGVLIAVTDSGEGFARGTAERMFDAFFTTKVDGMGMGLSICRSIIEAHGGHIRVFQAEGPGAVFEVRLPSAPAPTA